MAAYALTYRAPESHPAPGALRSSALALALIPLMGGAASLARPRWEPRRVAMGALLGDAAAVLPTLALYAFDPRRVVVAFVLVVQAEAGVVLGLPGGLWAWGVIGAASAGIEAARSGTSGMPVQPIELTIQLAVGVLLALGGGFLSQDLLGERRGRAEEKEAELRLLAEAEERYRALVEQIPVVAYIDAVDRMSSALYVSPRVEALLGYPPEDWTSDPGLWEKLLHPEDRDRVLAEHLRTNATGEPFRQEYRMRARDGRIVWVRDEAVLLRETGLPDRALLDQELALALARARRRGLAVGVLFLDLDRFKAINELFGHAGGDEVLRSVAARLRGAVRDTDLVTRHGGDEFLVLVADLERGVEATRPPPCRWSSAPLPSGSTPPWRSRSGWARRPSASPRASGSACSRPRHLTRHRS